MASGSQIDFKAQVLAATDIVQLIGQSVGLKKRGKDYVGLCPFHNEKSPSFYVSPARQFFYCFGCKAKGDSIGFIIQRDRVGFIDALRTLGDAAGLQMPKYKGSSESPGQRQALFDAQTAAVSFFENLLHDPARGAAGRDYLIKRGFNDETIKKFHVGLAIDSWDNLLRSPISRKFSPDVLVAASLLKARENGNGHYDTFRNRLMFPIRDESGRTIAFGGRVMPGSPDPAKYLNSSETAIFHKSRCAYGLDMARQRIVEKRTVAVVEGYTDVMMAHQFGVSNVVSILGTGMTAEHITLLRRFADKIVLLFDADSAGDSAADRVVELFLTQPVELAVASMPLGMDPDEYLLEHGAEAFEKVIDSAVDVLTYKWKQLSTQFAKSAGDLTGQQKAVTEYLDLLADARGAGPVDSIRWGSALARVSRLTDIPVDELNARFRNRKPKAKPAPLRPRPDNNSPGRQQPGIAPGNAAIKGPINQPRSVQKTADFPGNKEFPSGLAEDFTGDMPNNVAHNHAINESDFNGINSDGNNNAGSMDAAEFQMTESSGEFHDAQSGYVPGEHAGDSRTIIEGRSIEDIAAEQRLPPAQKTAERQILGLLLVRPSQWHDVQLLMQPHDFMSFRHRQIAEVYWSYQRDEGEPCHFRHGQCLHRKLLELQTMDSLGP